MHGRTLGLALVALLYGVACSGLASEGNTTTSPAGYPLDGVSRAIVAGTKLPCETDEVELVSYRGQLVRYEKPVRVHPAFRAQLLQFEQIVAELGRQHFGRAPRSIVHFGAYACRPMRRHGHWLSEHALGNAIDLAGFQFGPLPKRVPAPQVLPKALRRGFGVRVDKHWNGSDGEPRREFLHALAQRITQRPDVFRALVGPGWPGHDNHFHLAHPPYRMVKLGAVQRWFW
jgi:hypothetical protein